MKILFVYKNFYIYEFKALPQLAAVLKREGHEVRLALAEREDVVRIINEWKPEIIGYSITTGLHNYYLDLNRKIKKQAKIYSIFGGPHTTYFPETIEEEGVDAVCIGEGEEAIADFVNAFGTKKIRYIRNWWVKENGQIYKNDVRPLIEDLDKIPFCDREMMYSKDSFLRNNPQKTFLLVRGCPLKCGFCHNAAYLNLYKGKGRMVRIRSVDNAIREIVEVRQKYPLGLVRFDDDYFDVGIDWLRAFCKRYKEEINLPFHCRFTVNLVTDERVKLLRDAGCVSIQLGIESGIEEFRSKLICKNFNNQQYVDACRKLRQYRILVITNNIVGFPDETLQQALQTVKLNIKCKPAYAWCTIYQPYPKTPLGEYSIKNGYFDGDFKNIDYSYYQRSALKFKNKSEKRQIENLQKLLAVTASFPFLYPITRQLIKLPPNPIFTLIYRLWYGYTHRYIFPQKMSLWHELRYIKRFFIKDRA